MSEQYVKISKTELKELLVCALKLDVLERDGVDNWTWYMEGKSDCLKELAKQFDFSDKDIEKEDLDFEDIAEAYLEDYPEVKE